MNKLLLVFLIFNRLCFSMTLDTETTKLFIKDNRDYKSVIYGPYNLARKTVLDTVIALKRLSKYVDAINPNYLIALDFALSDNISSLKLYEFVQKYPDVHKNKDDNQSEKYNELFNSFHLTKEECKRFRNIFSKIPLIVVMNDDFCRSDYWKPGEDISILSRVLEINIREQKSTLINNETAMTLCEQFNTSIINIIVISETGWKYIDNFTKCNCCNIL